MVLPAQEVREPSGKRQKKEPHREPYLYQDPGVAIRIHQKPLTILIDHIRAKQQDTNSKTPIQLRAVVLAAIDKLLLIAAIFHDKVVRGGDDVRDDDNAPEPNETLPKTAVFCVHSAPGTMPPVP